MAPANTRMSLSGRPIGPYWKSARKRGDRITQKMLKTPLVASPKRVPGAYKPSKRSNLNRRDMEDILATHVVELTFKRRIKPPKRIKDRTPGHMKTTRRMLCTARWDVISHPKFRKLFNWKKPKSRRGKNWYRKRKLFIVWDLMRNAFRMISGDKYIIQGLYPLMSDEEVTKFLTFYRRNIHRRSDAYKSKFSDQG
jgi:hypothetical protein